MLDRLSPTTRRWIAGGTPALAWVSVGQPFDVIRTRLQASSTAEFRGAWHCLSSTVRHEGVRALWRGAAPQLLLSLPYSTLLFGTYAALRPAGEPSYPEIFLAGMASGVAVSLWAQPLDVWRTREQVVRREAGQSSGALRSLLRQRRQLLRGFSMTAVRSLPGNGAFFAIYEGLKANMPELSPALVGGATGVLFNFLLSPCDVLRARLMATSSGGLRDCVRQVFREHGALGLFRGVGVTTLKAFPVNAAGFAMLHYANTALGVL